MTSKYDLLRHAFGVQNKAGRWTKPYRNYFVAGNDDAVVWHELVADGFAQCTHPSTPRCAPSFAVTDAGRAAALAGITFKRAYGYGAPVNP